MSVLLASLPASQGTIVKALFVVAPPSDDAGLLTFNSSFEIVNGRVCSIPVLLGYVLASKRAV